MKTLIALISAFSAAKNLPMVKKLIRDYLGDRMIEENRKDEPFIFCNCMLENKDIEMIDTIVNEFKNVGVFFVHVENDEFADDYKCSVIVTPYGKEEI